jgi:plastocyanin
MTRDWLLTLLAMSPYFLAATIVVLAVIRQPAQIEQGRPVSERKAGLRRTSTTDLWPPVRRHNRGRTEIGEIAMEQLRSSRFIVVGAIVVGVLVVFVLAAVTLGGGTLPTTQVQYAAQAQGAAPSAPAQEGAVVSIANFAFQPDSLQIAAGSSVTWTNADSTAHTVTSDTGAFDAGPLAPGASFTQTFDIPGTYTYHCQIHPFMTGTIVVS